MDYEMWDAKAPYRTLIMASRHLHCLNDLLFRWSTGTLQIEIPAVVSNHPDAQKLCDLYGLAVPPHPGHRRTPRTRPRRSCCRWSRSTACT